MVLVQRGLDPLESLGNVRTRVFLHRHCTALFANHDVVFEEGAGVLRNRVNRPTGGALRRAVGRMRVAHGDDVGMFLVDIRMQDEPCTVHCVIAFNHGALVVHQDQVGHFHFGEMHAHRVGPVQFGPLRVADCQMAGEAVVKALQRKGAAGGDQAFLAVLAFCRDAVEFRQIGNIKPSCSGW